MRLNDADGKVDAFLLYMDGLISDFWFTVAKMSRVVAVGFVAVICRAPENPPVPCSA
jgi:hypothetical protein